MYYKLRCYTNWTAIPLFSPLISIYLMRVMAAGDSAIGAICLGEPQAMTLETNAEKKHPLSFAIVFFQKI